MEEEEMFYAASALNEGEESDSEEADTAMYNIPDEKENISKNKGKINYKLLNKQKIEEM